MLRGSCLACVVRERNGKLVMGGGEGKYLGAATQHRGVYHFKFVVILALMAVMSIGIRKI